MLQQIEYSGTVWALSHNDPEPLIEHSIKKLGDYGVKKEDIKIVDAPDNPEVGQVVVEIWPHELVVARIRTVRGESFISGTELNIELKSDESKSYEIISIGNTVLDKDSTLFIKNCTLDTGRTQPMYTYNIVNKERIYYIESAETWRKMFCCWKY